jgi:hypothetical protein
MWSRVQARFVFDSDRWYVQAARPAASIQIVRAGTATIPVPVSVDANDAERVEIYEGDIIRIKPHEFQILELWKT